MQVQVFTVVVAFLVSPSLAFWSQKALREKRSMDSNFDPSALVKFVPYPQKTKLNIRTFSYWEKKHLLHIHNAYRSLVRPYAADMVELQWDASIAQFAQRWANNCTATHQKSRNLGPWINMGENLYWWYGGRFHEAAAAKFWWDELQAYNISKTFCVPGEVCDHYVTAVWAKSQKMGCGISRCSHLSSLPDYGRGAYYIVCLYSGRFVNNIKPYTITDTPCSACHKTKFPKCRFNLCVNQDMIDKNIGFDGNTDITGINRELTISSKRTNGKEVVAKRPGTSWFGRWLSRQKKRN